MSLVANLRHWANGVSIEGLGDFGLGLLAYSTRRSKRSVAPDSFYRFYYFCPRCQVVRAFNKTGVGMKKRRVEMSTTDQALLATQAVTNTMLASDIDVSQGSMNVDHGPNSCFYNLDLSKDSYVRSDPEISVYSIEKLLRDYQEQQKQVGSTILSASILGTPVTVDGQSIESYFDDDVNILKYCLARIDEVEAINRFSHTPSAYSCILSFLAFLGQATHNDTRNDEQHFKEFCIAHLRELRCKRVERTESVTAPVARSKVDNGGRFKEDVNTLGEVLYKLVRCGLIHNMSSSSSREPTQNEVEVRLTHDEIPERDVELLPFTASETEGSVLKDGWKAVTVTINAFDLISVIRDAILHVYTDGTDAPNMKAYFKAHPPLMIVAEVQKDK